MSTRFPSQSEAEVVTLGSIWCEIINALIIWSFFALSMTKELFSMSIVPYKYVHITKHFFFFFVFDFEMLSLLRRPKH